MGTLAENLMDGSESLELVQNKPSLEDWVESSRSESRGSLDAKKRARLNERFTHEGEIC